MQMLFYSCLKPQRFLIYLSITSGQITTDFVSLRHKTMSRLTPLWVGYFSWAPPGGSPGLTRGHPCDCSSCAGLGLDDPDGFAGCGASCRLWCPGSLPHGLTSSDWLDPASLHDRHYGYNRYNVLLTV